MDRVRRTTTGATVLAAGFGAALMMMAAADARQATFNAHDDFTEYHMLDPASHQFHIVYYLNQRQVGATTLLNQTRSGSAGSDISVSDPQTGKPLTFEYKTGAELNAAGETGRLAATEHYIRAFLPRPVPAGGEGRVRIEKTYLDEKSYFAQGEEIVFARSLGIGRNAIVLPKGYAAVSSNVASMVVMLPDGRIKFVFENVNTYAADVSIRGRKSTAAVGSSLKVDERAFDFGKTLYDLGDPVAHEVSVQHEYVQTQRGAAGVFPEWLAQHRLRNVSVTDMDTGQALPAAMRAGAWAFTLAVPITTDAQSAHVRITARQENPQYRLEGNRLMWAQTLLEARATILLPAGWEVTAVNTPVTMTTTRDARMAIQIYNPRWEPVAIALQAVRTTK